MKGDDEQEMWDDMQSIQSLAGQGIDTSCRKIGELRDLHIRIFAITRHWITDKKIASRNDTGSTKEPRRG